MKTLIACLATIALVACGSSKGNNDSMGDGGGDPDSGGFDGGIHDAPFSGMCNPTSGAQCANCKDDDGDGKIDGFDPQCTGPLDNDEATFATGIPGDNKDAVEQDCFFDGDSGAGNDGCNIHVCCLLGATTKADCPIGQNKYDPNACPPPIGTGTISQKCKDTCGKLAPPGCDCFGCCTLCNPLNQTECYDIATNPATSPNCTTATLADPNVCKRCTKVTDCGNGTCGGTSCILCPGQTMLPPGCTMQECPGGGPLCGPDGSCPAGTYCANGCCIGTIL
jgi:hypothetical protein